jgi:GTPase SAR1 family protein
LKFLESNFFFLIFLKEENAEDVYTDYDYKKYEKNYEGCNLEVHDLRADNNKINNYIDVIQEMDFFVLVYDITNSESFEFTKKLFKFISKEKSSNPYILLIGNKLDLEDKREVEFDKSISKEFGICCEVIEVSALTNKNIKDALPLIFKIYKSKIEEVKKIIDDNLNSVIER